MKWNRSSSSLAERVPSLMNGSGRAKLLCARRMLSLFPMASPFRSGGNSFVNSRSVPSSCPKSRVSERLSRMERIACVAHALLITWLAKKTSELEDGLASSVSI